MTLKEFRTLALGKSKREILAILPKDTNIQVFTSRKDKIQVISVLGGAWNLYATLVFDKTTQRVIDC